MKLFLLVLAIALITALGLVLSAVSVGMVGAVFLQTPFIHGWHRAWERWGWLVVFWLFIFGSSSASRKKS